MGGFEVGGGQVGGFLVGFECVLGGLLVGVATGELGDVAVIVALHLEEEHLGLGVLRLRNQVVVQQRKDVVAEIQQLLFDFLFILSQQVEVLRTYHLITPFNYHIKN